MCDTVQPGEVLSNLQTLAHEEGGTSSTHFINVADNDDARAMLQKSDNTMNVAETQKRNTSFKQK